MCCAGGVLPWFAVRVRPRHEKIVSQSLRSKGYSEFLPVYPNWHHSSRHMERVDLPLFPGYIFCRLNPLNRLPILATPGVLYIVSFAGVPAAVDEREIDAVRAMVDSGLDVKPCKTLLAGDPVVILEGPLRGVSGTFVEDHGRSRFIVSVGLLQRSVSVEIDGRWVGAAKSSQVAAAVWV